MSGNRVTVHRRQGRPPDDDVFERETASGEAAGTRRAVLDLPGLTVGFDAMDEARHAAFLSWFSPYAADLPAGATATLLLRARRAGVEHFVSPPPAGRVEYNPVFLEASPRRGLPGHFTVRASTYSLAARFSTNRAEGDLLISRAGSERLEWGMENVMRVAVAWLAVSRGGFLMHAASIERDGRAWLFFGQSGAGKSTLAALSRRGQVISDDLTLLLPGPQGGLEAVGSPFRGTYREGTPAKGRFPVVAAFRLKHARPGQTALVQPLDPSRALPDAFANLPFVVDQLHASPELFDSLERALRSVPIHLLRFTRHDDSYWDAIEAAAL
ncbi:MAG: hypothetical protein ACREAA_00290 [Candidatus Polarisedimenticolia bacterium]